MAYATVAELKIYLDIAGSGDDTLLSDLLDAATAQIDRQTNRTFTAASSTRYYDLDAVEGQDLLLDEDLISITTLTNGDGTSLAATTYWLIPRNTGPPYHMIRLKSDYSWSFDSDGEVSVLGSWGYAASVPGDIAQACKRLAAYYYRQKDAQVFDVTAIPEMGMIQVPSGIPADVRVLLGPYKKYL